MTYLLFYSTIFMLGCKGLSQIWAYASKEAILLLALLLAPEIKV